MTSPPESSNVGERGWAGEVETMIGSDSHLELLAQVQGRISPGDGNGVIFMGTYVPFSDPRDGVMDAGQGSRGARADVVCSVRSVDEGGERPPRNLEFGSPLGCEIEPGPDRIRIEGPVDQQRRNGQSVVLPSYLGDNQRYLQRGLSFTPVAGVFRARTKPEKRPGGGAPEGRVEAMVIASVQMAGRTDGMSPSGLDRGVVNAVGRVAKCRGSSSCVGETGPSGGKVDSGDLSRGAEGVAHVGTADPGIATGHRIQRRLVGVSASRGLWAGIGIMVCVLGWFAGGLWAGVLGWPPVVHDVGRWDLSWVEPAMGCVHWAQSGTASLPSSMT